MATPVIMPRQGQSVESCIFSEWYVKTGDEVKKGDLLFAYETDKAAFEGESPEDGILLEIFAEPGDAIQVLENIGVIGQPGEVIDQFRPENAEVGEAGTGTEAEMITAKAGIEKTGAGAGSENIGAGTGKVIEMSETGAVTGTKIMVDDKSSVSTSRNNSFNRKPGNNNSLIKPLYQVKPEYRQEREKLPKAIMSAIQA